MIFPGNFKCFNERMQKFSPRGSGNDQFGHSLKLNLEVTKMIKMMIFSNFRFGARFEAGELQGSSQGIPKLIK